MTIDTTIPRTRRALLVGGIGGLAALVASALGRPLPVEAGNDGDVVLGATNTAAATTLVQNTTTTAAALKGKGTLGDGLVGESAAVDKSGVYGSAAVYDGYGVYGRNPNALGYLGGYYSGVYGESNSGFGVRGTSTLGYGVYATSSSGVGVYTTSNEGYGVYGESNSGSGVYGYSSLGNAVYGYTTSTSQAAVIGHSTGGRTGLLGFSGADNPPVAPSRTGVYGYAAQDASVGVHGAGAGMGVLGETKSGQGIYGQATSGTAGYFRTADPLYGYALQSEGRVRFHNCVGIATIASGASSILVSPGINLTSTIAVVATLQGSAGGTTTVHRCVVSTTANTFKIYLTANATQNTKVAWHVFG
jgi:hypothetical protein